MFVQRDTSDSMISRYSRTTGSAALPSREEIAATQAPIVASGLLISCITPAASWPTAASFSVWCMATWIARVSVTSSPMVITWVTVVPSSRIGSRVVR